MFPVYALARLKFRGSEFLGTAIFITYLVPQTLLFIPLADIIRDMQLGNTPWALMLTYPTFLIPFCTWLLMGYFKTIPRELEECARIDGATRFGAMVRIVFPVAVPGILSAGIFAFTLSWNEFIYALVFMASAEQKTVPVGVVSELVRGDIFFWGQLMAGALLGSVPVALVYSFFVEYYVTGLTGSVKGSPGLDVERHDSQAQQVLRRWVSRGQGRRPRDPRQGIHGARRPVRLRQDDHVAHGRRARGDLVRRSADRHAGRQRPAADGSQHRDGVPELRALSPQERVRQHGVRPADAQVSEARDRKARARGGGDTRDRKPARAPAPAALRRPAPARRRGARDRPPSRGFPVRRAAFEPGCEAARADAGGIEAAA